jgi:flagella basal body P-ring formation protein FlgA
MRTLPVLSGTGSSCVKSEKKMTNNPADMEIGFRRIKGREPRTQSIATRFTRSEERALQQRAEANGQNLREWARDVLLRVSVNESRAEMEMHIFTELVGIQMLLMDALDPLLRGERMAQEELAAVYRRVQTTKAAQAQGLLAKRNLFKEK